MHNFHKKTKDSFIKTRSTSAPHSRLSNIILQCMIQITTFDYTQARSSITSKILLMNSFEIIENCMGRNAYLILISVTTSTNRFNSQIISSTVKKRSILKGMLDYNSCIYCMDRGKCLASFGNFSTYTSSLSIRRFWGKGGGGEMQKTSSP